MMYGISSLVYPAETLCYFIIERKLKFDIGVGRVAASLMNVFRLL